LGGIGRKSKHKKKNDKRPVVKKWGARHENKEKLQANEGKYNTRTLAKKT